MTEHIFTNLCGECESQFKKVRVTPIVKIHKNQDYSINIKVGIEDTKTANIWALMFENEEFFDYYVDYIFNSLREKFKFNLRSSMPELQEYIRKRKDKECCKCIDEMMGKEK